MTPSGESKCAWCELELDTTVPLVIRLSTSSPPWTPRAAFGAARTIAAAGAAFAAAMRSTLDRPDVTLWFHRTCWDQFLDGLSGGRDVG